MHTAAFLRHVLADEGLICLTIKLDKYYKNHFFETVEDAARFAIDCDCNGLTVYHACSTFLTRVGRKQTNVALIKSLYSDVDVGDEKPYRTRLEASAALTNFLADTSMPVPTIVYSGPLGMHLYWVLEQAISSDIWKPYAIALRELCKAHGFHIDTTRAADSSSVLRPPGTHNRKRELAHPVTVAHLAPPVWLGDLPLEIQPQAVSLHRVKSRRLIEQTSTYVEMPSDANKVAAGCAHIAHIRDKKDDVAYELWLFAIWTIWHCVDGEATVHRWSDGHPKYSFEQTQRKLDEEGGPVTCAKFHEHDAKTCEACEHWGKISTPLQLGRAVRVAPPDEERQSGKELTVPRQTAPGWQPGAVNGYESSFVNTSDGLYFVTEDKKGQPARVLISSQPIELLAVCRAERNPDYSLQFQLTFPKAGVIPINIGTGTFFSAQGMPELHRLGAIIHDNDLMRKFVREKVDEYNRYNAPQTRFDQMGWKDNDNSFLVGNRLYTTQAKVITCATSPEIERRSRMLGPRGGSLGAWSAAANQLFALGCEPHSFALCCSFGAALMHFHSEEGGAIVNLVSEQSATGKTTGLEAVASVWGELDGVRLTDDDTKVSRGLLLGTLGNLPCVFDELHRRDPDAIRQFCVMFTNGRDRLRGKPDGSLREPVGDWQTILVLGSNLSIVDILHAKSSEEAQAFRVLEFSCEQNFSGTEGDKLRRTLRENAGHAGDAFIKWVMQPGAIAYVRGELDKAMQMLWSPKYGFERKHRFWVRCIACAFVAGYVVKHLGLLEFDPKRICDWAIARCRERKDGEFKRTHAQVLNEALYDIWASTLVVDVEWKAKNMCAILSQPNPNKGFYARRVQESGRMYVSRSWLYKWLTEHGVNKTSFMRELTAEKIIINSSKFITLGAGTSMLHGGGQIMCVEVNMHHPAMASIMEEGAKVLEFPRAVTTAPSPPASSGLSSA